MALARWKDLCMDAGDAVVLGRFWAAVLGRTVVELDDGEVRLDGERSRERVWIDAVPEPKTVKHRVHLDVEGGSLDPILEAGATVLRPEGDEGIDWTLVADPEGGELCVFVDPDQPEALPFHFRSLVVDCADPAGQARWWADVLGGQAVDDPRGFSSVVGIPRAPFGTLDLIPVPEPKGPKNRVHWDVVSGDLDAIVAAGATLLRLQSGDIRWSVLADPEGNEFCVFDERSRQ